MTEPTQFPSTPAARGSVLWPVLGYVAVEYAISWGFWLPLALSHQVVAVGGWPTHLPGLIGPALAAFTVTAIAQGRRGVRVLAANIGRWRIG